MSLLSNLKPNQASSQCKVQKILSDLEPKDAQILTDALADPFTWPARTLQNALKERSIAVSDNSITRHRKNHCVCAG